MRSRGPTVVTACALGLLAAIAVVRPAAADNREASVHLELAPLAALLEDPQDGGTTDTVAAGRLSVRGTYGLSDHLAAEASAGTWAGDGARFPDRIVDGTAGTIEHKVRALRVTAGATARLGVRWIPTLTAHAGYQHRWMTDGLLLHPTTGLALRSIADRSAGDLLLLVGAGLDYRFDAHWIAGVSAQYVQGISLSGNRFAAFEVPVHLSYYWYPPF